MAVSTRFIARAALLLITCCATAILVPPAAATDYFVTIAGGYSPEGNQASLEANVLFFQDVLEQQHRSPRHTATFFADGNAPEADLQVALPESVSETPATDLLKALHRFRDEQQGLDYRNHRVPNLAGPLEPEPIENTLKRLAASMGSGDRLLIYVTAHGSEARGRNRYNTTIRCWNDQSISARQFESWLDEVPVQVPVVMVMAQCYCGGFAHTIFNRADANLGLSDHRRIGFFAQQHDLAAAGCRPDIENDEEYSNFFWGAIGGRSRNGVAIDDADLNADGRISWSEAHAYAILASNTIDIPLSSTDALLRQFSRIAFYEHRRQNSRPQDLSEAFDDPQSSLEDSLELAAMTGSIAEIIAPARFLQRKIVEELVEQLELQLEDDVSLVFERFSDATRSLRQASRGSRRGRGSARRQLLSEIEGKYPELADRDNWLESELLDLERQSSLLEQLSELPAYAEYDESRQQFRQRMVQREQAELLMVKFQRLIHTLESIVLAQNLELVADQAVHARYQTMLELEDGFLVAPK